LFKYRSGPPQQLCNVYLTEQQGVAGVGLVAVSAASLVLWLLNAVILPSLEQAKTNEQ
jgi:hypothetical protein